MSFGSEALSSAIALNTLSVTARVSAPGCLLIVRTTQGPPDQPCEVECPESESDSDARCRVSDLVDCSSTLEKAALSPRFDLSTRQRFLQPERASPDGPRES